ncbi:hypothetical protein OKW21_004679 [Catalinimonas alkaloidigena]|uniref:hypothetical protein n=1 Tax=Catalinimonas alkaloidigena TaxID=1075417 RepID=UPI0024072BF9|nr:hypothetical protein [Catalinimonas alkaloidigena]MDF9799416.1 hypothetical protein [Catalinimonas alkaloidigena]
MGEHKVSQLESNQFIPMFRWGDLRGSMLLDNRIEYLLRHFEMLKGSVKDEALLMLERLIRYYKRNQHRMYYGFYKERKLRIGSGVIKSAHREVIQHRLKRSGQRWSKTGAQQIAQLRLTKKK